MNEKIAELSYKTGDKKITFSELNQDMGMEEFHQHCKELAAAAGYHPNSIEEWFDQGEVYDDIITKLNEKIRILEINISGLEEDALGKKPWLENWEVYS